MHNPQIFDGRLIRGNCGSRNGAAKLTEEMVTDIRRKWLGGKRSCVSLAVEYDVAPGTISKIVCNQRWAHVPWPTREERKGILLHDILGVQRAVATTCYVGALETLTVALMWGAMVGPRAILRAVFEMRFFGRGRKAALLKLVPDNEPPEPPSAPASQAVRAVPEDRDRGDEDQFAGLPCPPALTDFTSPRLFRSQARPLTPTDRSRFDEDVYARMASKRFQMIVGGREGEGGQAEQKA